MPSSFWSRQTSTSLVSGVPRWKPVPERPDSPAANATRPRPPLTPRRPTMSLAWFGSCTGKRAIAERVAVDHRDLDVDEAPAGAQAHAEIEHAGEQRAAHAAAFEEEAILVALVHLVTPGRAQKPDGRVTPRASRRVGRARVDGHLGVDHAGRGAVHRVGVQLQAARHARVVDVQVQARAADQVARLIQRRAVRRVDLVLRGAVVKHAVGLDVARQAHGGQRDSPARRPATEGQRRSRWPAVTDDRLAATPGSGQRGDVLKAAGAARRRSASATAAAAAPARPRGRCRGC